MNDLVSFCDLILLNSIVNTAIHDLIKTSQGDTCLLYGGVCF